MKQQCDKCGWIGENKDLKMVCPTSLIWGCPVCAGIFFKVISQKEEITNNSQQSNELSVTKTKENNSADTPSGLSDTQENASKEDAIGCRKEISPYTLCGDVSFLNEILLCDECASKHKNTQGKDKNAED